MKLNIWLEIPSKYTEDFWVIVSVALGMFSDNLTDTSCPNFFLYLFTDFYLTDMKKFLMKSLFFPESWPAIFVLFVSFSCYIHVGFCLKQKFWHCVLSFWLISVMIRSYMLIFFNTLESFQSHTLRYHCKHWN